MIKKLFLITVVALMTTPLFAQQDTIIPFISADKLPDLIKCLPAPPAFDSPEFSYDVIRYQWGKTQRLNPERAAIARRDAVWSYEALLAEFNVPFGLNMSPTETPEIWKLLTTSMYTTDPMRVAPKAFYHRLRPFEMYEEHLLSPETEAELSGEGSYPSGHTLRSWLAALILAEINPARADTLFARGWMYSESRVIEGAHWQSDVDASRVAASIGYAALQTSEAFHAQMAKAQKEFNTLTNKTMKKTLIVYFSATGTTKAAAQKLAQEFDADLYEITPEQAYTAADLDWRDKTSRSTIEMKDKTSRPAIKGRCANIADYDVVWIGFPIWWYTAPTIVNTFIEDHDLSGKVLNVFATSGGSGVEGSYNDLKKAYPQYTWGKCRLMN